MRCVTRCTTSVPAPSRSVASSNPLLTDTCFWSCAAEQRWRRASFISACALRWCPQPPTRWPHLRVTVTVNKPQCYRQAKHLHPRKVFRLPRQNSSTAHSRALTRGIAADKDNHTPMPYTPDLQTIQAALRVQLPLQTNPVHKPVRLITTQHRPQCPTPPIAAQGLRVPGMTQCVPW